MRFFEVLLASLLGVCLLVLITARPSSAAAEDEPQSSLEATTGYDAYPNYLGEGNYDWEAMLDEAAEEENAEKPHKVVHACWKDSEPRGRGTMPDRETRACPANLEKSMGMCYPKCGEKRMGYGPLCVDDCKTIEFKSATAFFCCDSDEFCTDLMKRAASSLPRALARMAIDIATNPSDARKIAGDFRHIVAEAMHLRLPMCSKLPPPPSQVPFFEDDELAEAAVSAQKDVDEIETLLRVA